MTTFSYFCKNLIFLAITGTVRAVDTTFGGQYRINSYALNDDDGAGDIAAARVRIRQNVDLKFSEQFNTHIQLNIGHINEGTGNHNLNQDGEPSVGLRHAVMDYKFSDAALLQAGLVPISDRFGDTLFSSDWDFNPVAVLVKGNAAVEYRVAWMKIQENGETDETAVGADTDNDMDAYLFDLGKDLEIANVAVMGLVIRTPENGIGINSDGYDYNSWIGIRAEGSAGADKCNWHVSAVNASVDKSAIGTADDAQGIQLLVKADGKVGTIGWGALALYSTGDKGTDMQGQDGIGLIRRTRLGTMI